MKNEDDIYEKASKLSRQNESDWDDFAPHYMKKSRKEKKGFFSKILRFFRKTILYLVCSSFAIVGIGAAGLVVILYFFCADLPDHNKLKNYTPLVATKVFLQDGAQLCEYSNEKRYFVPIELIPQKVINAFIAVEDKHFYQHAGVDFIGIARSMITNIKRIGSGRRPQGASTITQQVARIFLIKNNEVSYVRKIKEAILAYRIENALSKEQILELYLNQIYLGLGTYGVASAAKAYFNKTVDELSIAESAYLAILAKGANNYHPVKHKEKALIRRNWALVRLLEDGYISLEECEKATNEDLQIAPRPKNEYYAEYFSEEIRKDLKNKYPSESINNEGLVVRATLDSRLQKCAYFALKRGLEKIDRGFGWIGSVSKIKINQSKEALLAELKAAKLPDGGEIFSKAVILDARGKALLDSGENIRLASADLRWASKLRPGDIVMVEKDEKNNYRIRQLPNVQGAIVVMDVHSGRVLAMQGGYSFSQSEFNRATQANRQTGSVFKPFVYLAGLLNGFAPNTIIDASSVEIDLGPVLGIWKPRNYKDAVIDKITFRRALEKSINTATVRIAKEVGMEKISAIAKKFNLFEEMPHYFSYALGAGETTLLKLVTAYSMFANGGKMIEPTLIDYIQDINGKVIYKADARKVSQDDDSAPRLNDMRPQIEDERSIYQLTSLLEGVIQRGSGAPAKFLNLPIAGKTGTSNESRDTWFVGYTADIAVGVFVGFDDHSKSLGKNASGTVTALPIFIDFMMHARKFITPKPFRVPNGIKLRKIDLETGGMPNSYGSSVLEAFKQDETYNSSTVIDPLKNPAKVNEESTDQLNVADDQKSDINNDRAIPLFGVY